MLAGAKSGAAGSSAGGRVFGGTDDTVAPCLLGRIERRVCTRQQLLDAAGVSQAIRNADANGSSDRVTGNYRTGGLKGSADAFGGNCGVVRRSHNNGRKFLAAKPADHVAVAHRRLDTLGEGAKRRVPDSMAKAIVDRA